MKLAPPNGTNGSLQQLLLAHDFFRRILRAPFKSRMGLGHKGGNADRHPQSLSPLLFGQRIEQLGYLPGQVNDPQHVFIGLRRQPDHKVQLYTRPSGSKGIGTGPKQIFFRNVLVDHVPHALGTCLRCKGQPRFTDGLHLAQFPFQQRINAQAGQRHRHPFFLHPVHDLRQQRMQLGIIAGGKTQQRNLVISGAGNKFFRLPEQGLLAPLPHGAVNIPGLAEPAAPGTAPHDLYSHSVVNDLHGGYQLAAHIGCMLQILQDPSADSIRRSGFQFGKACKFSLGSIVCLIE